MKIRVIRVLNFHVQVFLNGRFLAEAQALVPISDRGFMYGDGLFETVRVAAGKPFCFAQHLERIVRGAEFLKIKLPFEAGELEQFAARLIEQNQMPEAILRLTLTRGPGERGYTPCADSTPTLIMRLHPAPPDKVVGWKLVTSSFRIFAADPLVSFKTLNKLTHVVARIEAVEKGADEALLVNTNGEAAETASGNLFWVYRDTVCTASTDCGALPGVTRAVVLAICKALGLPVSERAIKLETLRNSEGIFITQSALGIVSVTAFDGKRVTPSPLVSQIARAYREMLVRP